METCFGRILNANEMSAKRWVNISKARDWGSEFDQHKEIVLDERSIWFKGTFSEFTTRCAKHTSMKIGGGDYGMKQIAVLSKPVIDGLIIQIRRRIPVDSKSKPANIYFGIKPSPVYWNGIRATLIQTLPVEFLPARFQRLRQ